MLILCFIAVSHNCAEGFELSVLVLWTWSGHNPIVSCKNLQSAGLKWCYTSWQYWFLLWLPSSIDYSKPFWIFSDRCVWTGRLGSYLQNCLSVSVLRLFWLTLQQDENVFFKSVSFSDYLALMHPTSDIFNDFNLLLVKIWIDLSDW